MTLPDIPSLLWTLGMFRSERRKVIRVHLTFSRACDKSVKHTIKYLSDF